MQINNKTKNIHLNMGLRFKVFLGIIFFRLTLDLIYSKYISTIFMYEGYINDFNIQKYILSWGILIIFAPMIISLLKKVTFSSVILILLCYLSFVPFTTMVAFYPLSIKYIFANTSYWLLIFVFYKIIPQINIKRVKNDKIVNLFISSVIFIFSFTIVYISWRYTGFRLTLDIFNVYDLRSEASGFNLPTIISYIYSATKALNPVLIVYFLYRKKKNIAIIIFIIQVLSFSINGSKTVLLSTFLAVILYYFYSEKYLYKIPWILGILTIISGAEVVLKNTYILIAFLVRRVFFVPNLLNVYYFDFFSSNTPDYFRLSFLRHFGFQSEYRNIVYMIGDIYFNRPNMAANNGLFSDAYANLGAVGILVMPIILILSLRILDACSRGLNIKIFIVSAITMSFIFISSFFFTMLMTHGFIAVCVILYLLPRESEIQKNR